MELVNIKEFTKLWKLNIQKRISDEKIIPTLGIILVGNNPASDRYVKNKLKDCEEVGIRGELIHLNEDVSPEDFINTINVLLPNINGLIILLPLPKQLENINLNLYIPVEKDVDGFVPGSKFNPCTPWGIIQYLEYCLFDFTGANVTIIGRSDIVGKPMARLLTDKNCTVTLCHSKTKNLDYYIKNSDLIICAVGKANFLDCSTINCPVIDVGINFIDSKMTGDCYNTEGKLVTPVPGGVGLLTRCTLLENTLEAASI